MSTLVIPMAKKGSEAGGSDKSQGGEKTTVKLDAALHRRAKAVAAYQGRDLAEYLDTVIRPKVDKDFAKMAKDADRGDD
jgi:hypothetical protein